VLANRHFASIDDLEDAQAERCVALQARPDLIRSTTLFHWWPKRIHQRRGPRRREEREDQTTIAFVKPTRLRVSYTPEHGLSRMQGCCTADSVLCARAPTPR
jgi:hypothetical protein